MPDFEEAYRDFTKAAGMPPNRSRGYKAGAKSLWRRLASRGISPLAATREDVQEWLGWMESASFSVSTRSQYLSSARAFFGWLGEQTGMGNPTAGLSVSSVRSTPGATSALPPHKAKIVLNKCKASSSASVKEVRDECVLRLLMLSFVRPTEIVEADVNDFKKGNAGFALVFKEASRNSIKGVVPVDDETALVLRRYFTLRSDPAGEEPLFVSHARRNAGGRLNARTVNRIVNASLACVGETAGSVNFIKTAMGMALAAGADPADVKTFARMRSFVSVAASSTAAAMSSKHVGDYIAEFVDARRPVTVTAGEVRRMLAAFEDEDELVAIIDTAGNLMFACPGERRS